MIERSFTATPSVRFERATKRYGQVTALEQVSLDMEPGRVFGLFGPNGAGKSTLVRMLVGLVRPTDGRVWVAGADVVADPAAGRRACSFQPQVATPIGLLAPVAAIRLAGRLRGLGARAAATRARDLIDEFDLSAWATRPAQELSGGVARLVNYAMTVAAPAPVIVLDEPSNDVDPARRRTLWRHMRTLADGGATVVLVTHNVVEAEHVVDDLAILHHGRVVAAGSPDTLRASDALRLRTTLVAQTPPPGLAVEWAPVGAGRIEAAVPADLAVPAIRWASAARRSGHILDFALTPATLEDTYLGALADPR